MTTESMTSAFFGAYNARHINAEEVASQFVPSSKFWELIQLRNTLLVGPRGSGKTHLLKMLQPKALAAWDDTVADEARSRIGFWGVFIPADINWRAQVDERAACLAPEFRESFTRAIFISHVREAFITCLLQLTRDRPKNDQAVQTIAIIPRELETEFCKELATTWALPLRIPSLEGLRLGLVNQMSKLGATQFGEHSDYISHLLQSTVLTCAKEISETFIATTGIYDARWALCFDELEIAPATIQRELFQYLRSTDQRFIFKLAISPFNDESNALNKESSASAGNDYDAIPLWFTDGREREDFCFKLWDKQASRTKAKNLKPHLLLQRSEFQFPNLETNHGRRRYVDDGIWSKAFKELEFKDRSFSLYLRTKGIRSTGLSELPTAKMDAVVRKIAPLVGFRNVYFAAADGIAERRTLRSPPSEIFSGWEALCTATEGNPRWFCGMTSRLLLKWERSLSGRSITRDQQAQEFSAASRKFLAWISAIPVTEAMASPLNIGLRDLINILGEHFRESALGRKFTADPVLSFEVDRETPENIKSLLITALNVGAIVILDDQEVNFTLSNIVGHKFRLVHILAPHFSLPLRNGKSKRLSSILEISDRIELEKLEQTPQFALFSRPSK